MILDMFALLDETVILTDNCNQMTERGAEFSEYSRSVWVKEISFKNAAIET